MTQRVIVEADGGSRGNPGPAGYGAVLRDAPTGRVLAEAADGIGVASNNVAEYRGLIAGLQLAVQAGAEDVEVRMDSKLVVEQMSGRWKVRHPDMRVLAAEAAGLVRALPAVRFVHVPRERNAHADRLANEAMDAAAAGRRWSRAPSPPDVSASTPPATPAWRGTTGTATVTWLLRHGQTPMSLDRRFSGIGDPELTELGRAQAESAARRIAATGGIDVIVTSPLRRAADTAAAVAAALGLPVATEPGLRETDFGVWEGCTFAEVSEGWPAELAAWRADPDVAPPGGESFTATTTRVRAALARLRAAHPGRRLLLVSHVTPIKTLVRLGLKAPPEALHRMQVDLASVSRVDWYDDGPASLRLFNDTGHLRVP